MSWLQDDDDEEIIFTLDDLIEELIHALLGYTGEIFVDSSSVADDPSCQEILHPECCTISVTPDIDLADDVCREELNRLLQIGFHVKQIKAFIQQERYPADGKKSMYRRALCCGLEEVLILHDEEVVNLQDKMLEQLQHDPAEGGACSLATIAFNLAHLQRLLCHLHHYVYELRRRDPSSLGPTLAAAATATGAASCFAPVTPHSTDGLVVLPHTCGGPLLHWLSERKSNGEPVLRVCTQRLMWHVNQVLFNQLTLWMVHGQLINGGEEFFIKPNPDAAHLYKGTAAHSSKPAAAAAGAADTDAVKDAGGAGGGLGADRNSRRCGVCGVNGMDTALMTEADTYIDYHKAYVVVDAQLPPGMTADTAHAVQSVGRAVRLLKSAPAAAKLREMQDNAGSYLNKLNNLQQQGGGGAGSGAGVPQQLLPYGDAMTYAAALRVLREQVEYNPAALERTVEAIRADVAARVWQLVVVDSSLMSHLHGLKDYMLLAKGDFYQSFLAESGRMMGLPAEKLANKDLAVPWQSAATNSSAADDPELKYFRLVIDRDLGKDNQAKLQLSVEKTAATDNKPTTTATTSSSTGTATASSSAAAAAEDSPLVDLLGVRGEPAVADCLRLEAQLPWPLGVLITPDDIADYNKLFQLLLKVKRVQLDLEAAWQELGRLCGRKGGSKTQRDVVDLLVLRQHMGHLITNLQVYLQLDVIEAHFDTLQHKVAQAQDFAQVARAHTTFIKDVKVQSLVGFDRVKSLVHTVIGLARCLCAVIKGARDGDVDWQKVESIREAFIPAVRNLCLTMKSRTMVQQDKAPYLNKLHDRLDYNEFITHNIVKAPWGAAAGSSGPKGGGAGVGGAARSAQHQQQTPAGARRSSVI